MAHDPLTLIPPQFECPQPKLTPAVFPPIVKELPPPALDLFDLGIEPFLLRYTAYHELCVDEQFAAPSIRLAQLTNKCTGGEDDLDYFITESADILGVTNDVGTQSITAYRVSLIMTL